MPNIRILAKAVLQIFVHKFVPIQNACVGKRGVTQPKIYGICSENNQFIYTLVCMYIAKYQDSSQSGSSYILFTRLFLYELPVSEKEE